MTTEQTTARAETEHATTPPSAGQPPLSAGVARVTAGRRLPRTFAALEHPNFRLYWSGQIVSLSGTWMQTTAQNWLVYQLTLSPAILGVLSFANQAPTLVFSLFAGVLADRVNKRQFVMLTQALSMVQALALAALVLSGRVEAWHVIAAAAVLGTINAFDNPTRQALVPDLVPRADLMNAVALNSTAFNGARIVGPAIGGAVVGAVGAGGAFLLNAVSFLAVLLGLAKMEAPPKPRKPRTGTLWSHLGEGVRYIRGERTVSTLLLQAMAVGIFGIPYATLMPVMADQVLGLDASGYGYLLSAIGLGAVCGALTLASLGNTRYKGRIFSIGDAVFPVALLLFSLSRSMGLSVILLAVMGAGLITRNALTNTLIQTSVPDELRGRVISVYMLMFTGMTPFGALLSGFLAQSFGAPAALRAGAVVLMGTSLLVYWRRPEVRRL